MVPNSSKQHLKFVTMSEPLFFGCGEKAGGCEAPCPSPSPTAGEEMDTELLSSDRRRFVEEPRRSRDYSSRTVSDLTYQLDTGMFVPSLCRVWGTTSAQGKAWVLQKWAGDTVTSAVHGAVQKRGGENCGFAAWSLETSFSRKTRKGREERKPSTENHLVREH